MLEPTPLYGGNAEFLDALYEQYLRDPASVSERWRAYFDQLSPKPQQERAHGPIRAAIGARAQQQPAARVSAGSGADARQAAVSRLIQVWINRGHLVATIDPLGLMTRPQPRVLDLDYFGLTPGDLDTEFFTGSRTDAVPKRMKLRDILEQLRYIYGGNVGAEFAHVSDSEERLWLQDEFQNERIKGSFSPEERRSSPVATDRGRRPRALPAHQVRRSEALLARRRGGTDRLARRSHPRQRCGGHRGGGHRHGAPRPAQRARQCARQVSCGAVLGVRGCLRPQARQGLRRRQVPQRLLRRPAHPERQRAHGARLQPLASRGREPGRGRVGPRPPGALRRCPRGARPAAADSRRCGLRGPGRGDGDAAAVAGARLLHRRHRAPHHQQSGRLHDLRSPRRALDYLLQRRRQDAGSADLPRECR